ncbi:hypothetical protein [Candidatus Palauibacter sp.]|uniref:hypothetical protein n=1 Tax=Candidatus Palauibacter sp. TaxID=3101350 RepID=UPI003D13755E
MGKTEDTGRAIIERFTSAFLDDLREPAEDDTYGICGLLEFADGAAAGLEVWKAVGKPADGRRQILVGMAEACRVRVSEVDGLLKDARRGAPGRTEAEQALLAARETVSRLLDELPSYPG